VSLPADKAVTANPSFLGTAFDACPESIAVVDRGRILHANPAFARLFGYGSSSDLWGTPLDRLLPMESHCAHTGNGRGDASRKGRCGYSRCVFEGHRKDGSHSTMEGECSQLAWQGHDLLVIAARDVSQEERRRVVRDSEMRFRSIFQAAAIGICQCTIDGIVVESNPALQKMLGYREAEMRGMHFREFSHPEEVQHRLELFHELMLGKRESYQLEVRFRRKNGEYLWVRLTVSLVRGPDGRSEFSIGMAEDITEQKKTAEKLRAAQKMEVVGRMASGVAHDFNNLLTGLRLYSDLISGSVEGESPLRRYATEIKLATEQGGALVRQLLAIARQHPIAPRAVSVDKAISGTENLLRQLLGDRVELEIFAGSGSARVKIDPAQLQQVTMNLALNARDAMPEGGRIRLQTRVCERQLGESSVRVPVVSVSIMDSGSGIDAETRSHLFEPFYTTKVHGNGLGLATVHSIVKQAGGEIEVESEPGKGTCMTVLFPVVSQDGGGREMKRPPTKIHRVIVHRAPILKQNKR